MILTDIVLAIPIGILYNVLTYELIDIFNNNLIFDEKIQINIIFNFAFGIIGLFLGYYIFGKHNKLRNNAIKYGLYFGSCLLLFNTILYNWYMITPAVKIILFGVVLILLLWASYKIS